MVYSVASLMSKKLHFIHGYGVTNVDPQEHFLFAKASLLGAHSRGLGSPQRPSRSDIRAEKHRKTFKAIVTMQVPMMQALAQAQGYPVLRVIP
jgi:hypothetical protein